MTLAQTNLGGVQISAEEPVLIKSNGASLQGILYRPTSAPKAAIILHGATGVAQRFYRHFAKWLAEEGYACLTYDYRDFGASAKGHVKTSNATMSDWGLRDQEAAQEALERMIPNAPLWVIGHSFGGFMVPFHSGSSRIARLIAVSSGPTNLRDHPWHGKLRAGIFWSLPVKLLSKVLGYLPGRLFGMGPSLPLGVYLEWRRWCITRGFYMPDIGHSLPMPDWAAMQGDAKFVAVSDDWMIPPHVVWRLMQYYPEAMKKQLIIRPEDYGLKHIGHIAMFAEKSRAVWPAIIE